MYYINLKEDGCLGIDYQKMNIYAYYDSDNLVKSASKTISSIACFWPIDVHTFSESLQKQIDKKIAEYNSLYDANIEKFDEHALLWFDFDWALSLVKDSKITDCVNISIVLPNFNNSSRVFELYNITANSSKEQRDFLYRQLKTYAGWCCGERSMQVPRTAPPVNFTMIGAAVLARCEYDLAREVITDYSWVEIVLTKFRSGQLSMPEIMNKRKSFLTIIDEEKELYNPMRCWLVLKKEEL